MTPEQFDNWKDFCLRMARHGFDGATARRSAGIEEEVNGFFSWYDRDSEDVRQIVDWDNSPTYICDRVSDWTARHEHYRYNRRTGNETPRANRFANQVTACLRAGLDCASSPSAGVLGFTVGDLRRMYPEGIPEWAIKDFDPPVTAQTPDTAGVWL